MKILIIISSILISFNTFAVKKEKSKKVVANTAPTATPSPTSTAPCDTKEDLLKKLEEEKKKLKPFSLQGGNTGCSVNEKK